MATKKVKDKMNCFAPLSCVKGCCMPEDLCESAKQMVLEGFWGVAANLLNMSIGATENIPVVGVFTKKSIPYLKRIVANLEEE